MIAARVHLDDCGDTNGPLRVIPGSHRRGILGDRDLSLEPKENAITLTAHRGDVILMRPLLLHASSAATVPLSRRVLHIEFAGCELPNGLEWHDRI